MHSVAEIRPSPIVGTWYTADPLRLAEQMDAFIQQSATPSQKGRVFGLLVPHAGHRYSGATAGCAYRAVLGATIPLVVIISPSHAYHPAELLSSAHHYYATPLGNIPVHQDSLRLLQQGLQEQGAALQLLAEDEEHAIEIQLPFLQRALQDEFALLPVMMRSQSAGTVQQLANALFPILQRSHVLVIASSDLSHFYPLAVAGQLDGYMLNRIEECSPQAVLKAEMDGSGSACGAGAIAAVLELGRQACATRVKILQHSTSADVTGDASSVVGYASAVITYDGS
jgi:MEMO1 family protein